MTLKHYCATVSKINYLSLTYNEDLQTEITELTACVKLAAIKCVLENVNRLPEVSIQLGT